MDTVIVLNSQFYSHYPKRIPKGTVNAEAVLVRLDPEWEGLTVRIHWLNVASGVEKVVLLERDQPNTIPWEVLVDLSELRMGLDGMDGGTIVKPTVWLTYGYVVDGVDPESGSDPHPPTPSWEQQMVEQATAAANAAKAAKETADNLQASAEAGEFNGDPGPAGPPGKSPIIQDGNWWLWDVEAQEYRDTGIAASGGGGGGTTNYQDLSNKPSINGVELLGNKTAQDLGLQPKGDYATTSSKLANPFFITFTGAVEATYDGSQAVTVTIPTIAGPPGTTPDIQIGTVDTLEPGSDATATITGTPESPRLNLGIPRGQNGKTPVKGIDYFTEAEKQEIAEQTAGLVPGGSEKWEKLVEYTVTEKEELEPPDAWVFDKDMSKNPISVSKIALFADAAVTATGKNLILMAANETTKNVNYLFNKPLMNNGKIFFMAAGGNIDGNQYAIGLASNNPQHYTVSPYISWCFSPHGNNGVRWPFDGMRIHPNGANFKAGTKFEIWGVKA